MSFTLWPTTATSLLADLRARAREAVLELRGGESLESFQSWLERVTPAWHWRWDYLVHIQEQLDRVTRGEIDRLMLFVPPRHGKSEMTTVRYPVYRLQRNPELRVIIGAYNDTLARKFSRKARRIAGPRISISEERTAVEDWETVAGGGVRAVGVGAGVTGMGGDLIVIDDPVKNREEAESEIYRDKVWEWYTDDLYTRLEPGGALILIMTRWHEDDLAGRILASDDGPNWSVVRLPALAEDDDPLGRAVGEALCPERFDEEALARIRSVQTGYSFEALYQQRPTAKAGEMFNPAWFTIVDAMPANVVSRVRWWDRAATKNDGDFTAGLRMSRTAAGLYVIEHVERGQWDSGTRDRMIKQTAQMDPLGTVQLTEQEPGSSGKDSAIAFVRMLARHTAGFERATGDKIVRAGPLASQAEIGNVRLVRGEWNRAFLDELRQFPHGKHDDQVDAAAGALNRLARVGQARPPARSVSRRTFR